MDEKELKLVRTHISRPPSLLSIAASIRDGGDLKEVSDGRRRHGRLRKQRAVYVN